MTPTEIISPPDTPSLAIVLTMLGFGKETAAIVSLITGVVIIIAHILPWLPVPETGAKGWWPVTYRILAGISGSYHKAAPVAEDEKLVPPTK